MSDVSIMYLVSAVAFVLAVLLLATRKKTTVVYHRARPVRRIENDEVLCPRCGSAQVVAQKHGFSLAKAALGIATVGGVALGFLGSGKIDLVCIRCGNKWRPGK